MAPGYDETGTPKTHLWMALRALSTASIGLALAVPVIGVSWISA